MQTCVERCSSRTSSNHIGIVVVCSRPEAGPGAFFGNIVAVVEDTKPCRPVAATYTDGA